MQTFIAPMYKVIIVFIEEFQVPQVKTIIGLWKDYSRNLESQ